MHQAIDELELSPPTKKAKKLVRKASKKISVRLKSDFRKLSKKADKIARSLEKKEKRLKKKAGENNGHPESSVPPRREKVEELKN